MERFKNIFGWSEELIDIRPNGNRNNVKQNFSKAKTSIAQPVPWPVQETEEITFKWIINEVFGWPVSVMNLVEEKEEGSPPKPDDSDWYNNEDPDAVEESRNNTEPGATQGDTSTKNDQASTERSDGNKRAGAGAA